MRIYCQKDYDSVPYGDATISENGCACCIMASLTGKEPPDIAEQWGTTYWDDEDGTLPEAFDNAANDMGIVLNRVNDVSEFMIGDTYVVLACDEQSRHYELLRVLPYAIELIDPRVHGSLYCEPSDAHELLKYSIASWKVNANPR